MILIRFLRMDKLNRLFELCPTLKRLAFDEQVDALVRMNIAHAMNGGEYVGLYETAIEYLEGLKHGRR